MHYNLCCTASCSGCFSSGDSFFPLSFLALFFGGDGDLQCSFFVVCGALFLLLMLVDLPVLLFPSCLAQWRVLLSTFVRSTLSTSLLLLVVSRNVVVENENAIVF